MARVVQCPECSVELTIPEEAGAKRLRCPKCSTRFHPEPPGGTKPPTAQRGSAAEKRPEPRPVSRVKVPPSSGAHDIPLLGGRSGEHPRLPSGDLPVFAELSSLDDLPVSRVAPPVVTDAEALFRDDPAPVKKRPPAEARREARRCPSCGGFVLGGMSLCNRCGLDLDTGIRHKADDYLDDIAEPEITDQPGTPISVLLIGLTTLAGSVALGLLSVFSFEGIGRICLTLTCLFGVIAAVQFLQGRTYKALVVALLLGGAVNVVTMIVLPVVWAEYQATPDPNAELDAGITATSPESTNPEVDLSADPTEVTAPIARMIDMSRVATGVALLFADALLLVWISLPNVQEHFRDHRQRDEAGEISV